MVKKAAVKKAVEKADYVNGFVFTGDKVGGCDPAWIEMHGYLFGLNGRVVEVNDTVAAKLRNHSHFTEAK